MTTVPSSRGSTTEYYPFETTTRPYTHFTITSKPYNPNIWTTKKRKHSTKGSSINTEQWSPKTYVNTQRSSSVGQETSVKTEVSSPFTNPNTYELPTGTKKTTVKAKKSTTKPTKPARTKTTKAKTSSTPKTITRGSTTEYYPFETTTRPYPHFTITSKPYNPNIWTTKKRKHSTKGSSINTEQWSPKTYVNTQRSSSVGQETSIKTEASSPFTNPNTYELPTGTKETTVKAKKSTTKPTKPARTKTTKAKTSSTPKTTTRITKTHKPMITTKPTIKTKPTTKSEPTTTRPTTTSKPTRKTTRPTTVSKPTTSEEITTTPKRRTTTTPKRKTTKEGTTSKATRKSTSTRVTTVTYTSKPTTAPHKKTTHPKLKMIFFKCVPIGWPCFYSSTTPTPMIAATNVAGSVGSVGSVGSAGSAGSVGSIGSPGSVGPPGSPGSAGSTGSTGSAGSAGSAGSSESAGSMESNGSASSTASSASTASTSSTASTLFTSSTASTLFTSSTASTLISTSSTAYTLSTSSTASTESTGSAGSAGSTPPSKVLMTAHEGNAASFSTEEIQTTGQAPTTKPVTTSNSVHSIKQYPSIPQATVGPNNDQYTFSTGVPTTMWSPTPVSQEPITIPEIGTPFTRPHGAVPVSAAGQAPVSGKVIHKAGARPISVPTGQSQGGLEKPSPVTPGYPGYPEGHNRKPSSRPLGYPQGSGGVQHLSHPPRYPQNGQVGSGSAPGSYPQGSAGKPGVIPVSYPQGSIRYPASLNYAIGSGTTSVSCQGVSCVICPGVQCVPVVPFERNCQGISCSICPGLSCVPLYPNGQPVPPQLYSTCERISCAICPGSGCIPLVPYDANCQGISCVVCPGLYCLPVMISVSTVVTQTQLKHPEKKLESSLGQVNNVSSISSHAESSQFGSALYEAPLNQPSATMNGEKNKKLTSEELNKMKVFSKLKSVYGQRYKKKQAKKPHKAVVVMTPKPVNVAENTQSHYITQGIVLTTSRPKVVTGGTQKATKGYAIHGIGMEPSVQSNAHPTFPRTFSRPWEFQEVVTMPSLPPSITHHPTGGTLAPNPNSPLTPPHKVINTMVISSAPLPKSSTPTTGYKPREEQLVTTKPPVPVSTTAVPTITTAKTSPNVVLRSTENPYTNEEIAQFATQKATKPTVPTMRSTFSRMMPFPLVLTTPKLPQSSHGMDYSVSTPKGKSSMTSTLRPPMALSTVASLKSTARPPLIYSTKVQSAQQTSRQSKKPTSGPKVTLPLSTSRAQEETIPYAGVPVISSAAAISATGEKVQYEPFTQQSSTTRQKEVPIQTITSPQKSQNPNITERITHPLQVKLGKTSFTLSSKQRKVSTLGVIPVDKTGASSPIPTSLPATALQGNVTTQRPTYGPEVSPKIIPESLLTGTAQQQLATESQALSFENNQTSIYRTVPVETTPSPTVIISTQPRTSSMAASLQPTLQITSIPERETTMIQQTGPTKVPTSKQPTSFPATFSSYETTGSSGEKYTTTSQAGKFFFIRGTLCLTQNFENNDFVLPGL